MKSTVKQVSNITGISIRTLHYYDEIGLLKPSEVTDAGYRIYDGKAFEKLQQILFFRELGFELKDINSIMSDPEFDQKAALLKHKELLMMKRNRLDGLINLVDDILKGESNMSFKEFDMTEIEKAQQKYQQEAEQRWGSTDAYKQSVEKTRKYNKDDWKMITQEAEEIYRGFVANMDKEPGSEEVQKLVGQWQDHITKNYYNCTKEILQGLGQMYVADERFTKNIDKYGEGLAQFMSKAIAHYCSRA